MNYISFCIVWDVVQVMKKYHSDEQWKNEVTSHMRAIPGVVQTFTSAFVALSKLLQKKQQKDFRLPSLDKVATTIHYTTSTINSTDWR